MRNLGYKVRVRAFLVVGILYAILANAAWAHINATCNPAQNKIKAHWMFPCSGPPPVHGDSTVVTRGDPPETPPANAALTVIDFGPGGNNLVIASGSCIGGEEGVFVITNGCAKAGGTATPRSLSSSARIETLDEQPWASVGLGSASAPVPPESMVRIQVDRIVTPGSDADIVRLWFLSGVLQTRTVPGHKANSTLKLIVYPDQTTADADSSLLAGQGSAFFGQATLVGALGTLEPRQGFSSGDFVTQDDGGGQFSARPSSGLFKTVLVPDATTAVVSLVGDPESGPAATTGVGDETPSGLWLGSAMPNPARGEMRIRFAIPASGPVTLRVYDQQGRHVRALVASRLPAGIHEAAWDGRDGAGRRVPSAAYFYRLEMAGRSLTGKVFTIR